MCLSPCLEPLWSTAFRSPFRAVQHVTLPLRLPRLDLSVHFDCNLRRVFTHLITHLLPHITNLHNFVADLHVVIHLPPRHLSTVSSWSTAPLPFLWVRWVSTSSLVGQHLFPSCGPCPAGPQHLFPSCGSCCLASGPGVDVQSQWFTCIHSGVQGSRAVTVGRCTSSGSRVVTVRSRASYCHTPYTSPWLCIPPSSPAVIRPPPPPWLCTAPSSQHPPSASRRYTPSIPCDALHLPHAPHPPAPPRLTPSTSPRPKPYTSPTTTVCDQPLDAVSRPTLPCAQHKTLNPKHCHTSCTTLPYALHHTGIHPTPHCLTPYTPSPTTLHSLCSVPHRDIPYTCRPSQPVFAIHHPL